MYFWPHAIIASTQHGSWLSCYIRTGRLLRLVTQQLTPRRSITLLSLQRCISGLVLSSWDNCVDVAWPANGVMSVVERMGVAAQIRELPQILSYQIHIYYIDLRSNTCLELNSLMSASVSRSGEFLFFCLWVLKRWVWG